MRIASWNINSVKARLPHLITWLKDTKPDIVGLQELKSIDEAFPFEQIEELGYNIAVHGQKSYNGVALLSRFPLEDVRRGLPDYEDEQARFIEAFSGGVRVASLYLPNGNPVEDGTGKKYLYKLGWMDALNRHAQALLDFEESTILAGDYNVIPYDADTYDPQAWQGDALFRPETHAKFRTLKNLGYTEALETLCTLGTETYTFWDYQAGAWHKNKGIRIDHHLLSPHAADRLIKCGIDKYMRGLERPSDHVPVWIELSD